MTDRAEFQVEVIDSASRPADRIAGSADRLASSLDKLGSKTVSVSAQSSKMDKALGAVKFTAYGAKAAFYGKKLFDAAGGLEGVSDFARRTSRALRRFGTSVGMAAKRIAPFAVGAAGLYGLGHVASSVAVPALGAVAAGIGGIVLAAGAATIAVGGLAAALGAVGLKATAEFAVFGQSSKFALQQLAKYGASGEKLFQHATGLAVRFGMDVQDTTKSFQKLLATQFNPKLATDIIAMGADLRSIGGSAEETKGAIRAITQIKSTGRLLGDELLQLAEAGVSVQLIREELGKLLGKGGKQLSNLEVLKLQEAGKIDADTAITGILNAVKHQTRARKLGEAGEAWANTTIAGMAGRLKARGQLLLTSLGDRLAPSLQRLASGALSRIEGFLESPKGAEMIDRIGRAFDRLGDAAVSILPLITAFGEGFIEAAGKALDELSVVLGGLGGQPGQAAVDVARMLGSGLAKLVGWGIKTTAVVAGLGAAVAGTLGVVVTMPDRFIQLGGDLMKGLAKGITAFVTAPIDAIKSMGERVIGAAARVFGSHSPSRRFEEVGYTLPQGQARGMLAGERLVVGAAATLALSTIRASEINYGPLMSTSQPGFAQIVGTASTNGMTAAASRSIQIGSITIPVNSPNADSGAVARDVRREIEAYFRQLEMEA